MTGRAPEEAGGKIRAEWCEVVLIRSTESLQSHFQPSLPALAVASSLEEEGRLFQCWYSSEMNAPPAALCLCSESPGARGIPLWSMIRSSWTQG